MPGTGSTGGLCLSDVLCHICLGILIEPVTMPCGHRMCKVCFQRNLELNSTQCPMCKRRIATWARRHANNLVDQKLWLSIQEAFPDRVSLRQAGLEEDAADLEELFPCVATHAYAERGSIKQEFDNEINELRQERERAIIEEEQASEELIRQLQKEDEEEAASARSQQRISRSPASHLCATPAKASQERSIRDLFGAKQTGSKQGSDLPSSFSESCVQEQMETLRHLEQSQKKSRDYENKANDNELRPNNAVANRQCPEHEGSEPSTSFSTPSAKKPAALSEIACTFSEHEMESQLEAFRKFEQEQRDQELARRLASSPQIDQENRPQRSPCVIRAKGKRNAPLSTPKQQRLLRQMSLKESLGRRTDV